MNDIKIPVSIIEYLKKEYPKINDEDLLSYITNYLNEKPFLELLEGYICLQERLKNKR